MVTPLNGSPGYKIYHGKAKNETNLGPDNYLMVLTKIKQVWIFIYNLLAKQTQKHVKNVIHCLRRWPSNQYRFNV